MDLEREVVSILEEAMGLPAGRGGLRRDTALLGGHPDFTSMSVVAVFTGLEARLGLLLDEDLGAAEFASVGSLVDAVAAAQAR